MLVVEVDDELIFKLCVVLLISSLSFDFIFLDLIMSFDRYLIGYLSPVFLIIFQKLANLISVGILISIDKRISSLRQKWVLDFILDPLDFTLELLLFAIKLLE